MFLWRHFHGFTHLLWTQTSTHHVCLPRQCNHKASIQPDGLKDRVSWCLSASECLCVEIFQAWWVQSVVYFWKIKYGMGGVVSFILGAFQLSHVTPFQPTTTNALWPKLYQIHLHVSLVRIEWSLQLDTAPIHTSSLVFGVYTGYGPRFTIYLV